MFSKEDADADGKIGLEEFQTWVTDIQKRDLNLSEDALNIMIDAFSSLDT